MREAFHNVMVRMSPEDTARLESEGERLGYGPHGKSALVRRIIREYFERRDNQSVARSQKVDLV